MQETIEVELRGPINKRTYADLIKFFTENGSYKSEKNRILIDYSTFLASEGIRERKKDIRLRVTNGIPEIIVKLGSWGGSDSRKELSVLTHKGEFDELVQIFAALGLTKGVLCIRNSQVFEYKGIEFSLVEVPNHSYYFEAEKMIQEENNEEKIKEEIRAIVESLNLTLFSDEDFFQYVETLNKEANEVFDFSSYQENYFKKRFSL